MKRFILSLCLSAVATYLWNVGHEYNKQYQDEEPSSKSQTQWKFKNKSARQTANDRWNMNETG